MYTGSRNGSIRRFDTRTRGPGLTLLGEAFTKSSNSITYLNIIKDWQLLVSTIRGAVSFSRSPLIGTLKLKPYIGAIRLRYSTSASCKKRDRSWPSSETSTHTSQASYATPRAVKFLNTNTLIALSLASHTYPISRLFFCRGP